MKKTIILILTLSLLLNAIPTYAFWNTTAEEEQIVVIVGDWLSFPVWQPNKVYQKGDIVFHNGSYWIKTSNASNSIEPSSSPPGRNFWQMYN